MIDSDTLLLECVADISDKMTLELYAEEYPFESENEGESDSVIRVLDVRIAVREFDIKDEEDGSDSSEDGDLHSESSEEDLGVSDGGSEPNEELREARENIRQFKAQRKREKADCATTS